jgi:two-component sensor histidine kinase
MLVPLDKMAGHHHSRQQFLANPSTRPMAELKELFARRRDGSLFPVEIGLTYLEGDSKVSVLATVTDVTDAKAVQQDLQQIVHDKTSLLAERTALLNEVHHRVKNNLQVMSSLLSLQSRNAAPELKQAFAESQMRVRTMALTHQLLYENRNFSSVPLAVYLEQLCRLIQQTLAPASQIRFNYDAMDSRLLLDLELTIPCGLLVNEVVTNSLKHAFVTSAAEGGPAERGEVSLGLQALADGRYQLQISDNGIGMPAQAQLGSGASMGMQLIPAFIAQLNAELQLERQPGTCYRVSFHPQKEAR